MDTSAVPDRFNEADNCADALIIGGGISGTLTAIVLGRAGYRVCLIDRYEVYPRDFRAEHLDGTMIELLARLGVLGDLTHRLYRGETVAVARHGRIFVTAPTVNFGLRYETMVNRARHALPENVQVVTGRVTKVVTSDRRQRVDLADGRTFHGRLVILATGQGAGLCKQIGIRRRVLRGCHSLTFGFNIQPAGSAPFANSFLVYQRERIQDRIDYLAAFTLGERTRVNLFTYRDYKEPWTKAFVANPDQGLRQVLPALEPVLGPYQAYGPVEARPIDLYVSDNVHVNGAVLIGDAFLASCPATGTGMVRLLTDIEQLCRFHLPRWFQSPGMGVEKIAEFYRNPIKRAHDAKALHDSEYRRAVSTEMGLRWNLHRARVQVMEQVQAWRRQAPMARRPRIGRQQENTSPAKRDCLLQHHSTRNQDGAHGHIRTQADLLGL